MKKILYDIKKEMEKQGLSDSELARRVGCPQNRVSRLLSGTTKTINPEFVQQLVDALGIVADPGQAYGVTTVHRALTPEEENLLNVLNAEPLLREAMEAFMALPPRKQKIQLGKMLEDLEKLEEEGKG